MFLAPQLFLELQVAAVALEGFACCTPMCQLHPYLSYSDLTTVIHVLVFSSLGCYSAFYVTLPLKTIWKLLLLQDVIAWVMTWVKQFDSVMPLLYKLHWVLIHF